MRGRRFNCKACLRSLLIDEGICSKCIEFGTPLQRCEREIRNDRLSIIVFSNCLVLSMIIFCLRYSNCSFIEATIVGCTIAGFSFMTVWNMTLYRAAKSCLNEEICKQIHES